MFPLNSLDIDIQHFTIQYWADTKEIVTPHISSICSIPDVFIKAVGWVLCSSHGCHMMGHCLNALSVGPYFAYLIDCTQFFPTRSDAHTVWILGKGVDQPVHFLLDTLHRHSMRYMDRPYGRMFSRTT